MIERLSTRVIAALVAAVLVLGLVWFAVHEWQSARTNAARARLSTNQSQAVSDSAKDAINATGAVSARSGATDDTTRKNADEIDAAKGADAPVDPAVRDAGLRSLCRRPGFARKPECVRLAAPSGMEGAGARR